MSDKCFVDTNILVYAHDLDSGAKRETAKQAIKRLWNTGTGVISTQVLHEFYVTLTRKITKPLAQSDAKDLIKTYFPWEIVTNDPETFLHAIDIETRHTLSFWDSLIIAAASSANAAILLTEDLNHGQIIEGIRIQSPFKNPNEFI